jgi:hypothetical protein
MQSRPIRRSRALPSTFRITDEQRNRRYERSQPSRNFERQFIHDRKTTFKKDRSPLDPDTISAYQKVTRELLDITRRTFPGGTTGGVVGLSHWGKSR